MTVSGRLAELFYDMKGVVAGAAVSGALRPVLVPQRRVCPGSRYLNLVGGGQVFVWSDARNPPLYSGEETLVFKRIRGQHQLHRHCKVSNLAMPGWGPGMGSSRRIQLTADALTVGLRLMHSAAGPTKE